MDNFETPDKSPKEAESESNVYPNDVLKEAYEEMLETYPTVESAVDVYRSGALDPSNLHVRFTPEEIDQIKALAQERNEADKENIN